MINVLDHGYVKYIEHWGSDERIIESARMSTQKGFEGWGSDKPQRCVNCWDNAPLEEGPNYSVERQCPSGLGHSYVSQSGDEKLLAYLWKNQHSTPFEMAGMTLEVRAPIFVIREWQRHRTQSFNEASARYSLLSYTNYVPTIERLMMSGGKNKQAQGQGSKELTEDQAASCQEHLVYSYRAAEIEYQTLLAKGVSKELARLVLPVGRYSCMRASANLRNWLSFLTLRTAPNAQWEIQEYAGAVQTLLTEHFPRTLSLWEKSDGSK